jgi:hypothetical protein
MLKVRTGLKGGGICIGCGGNHARRLLGVEHVTPCKHCRHGKAAHKGACRMKHCKCTAYA